MLMPTVWNRKCISDLVITHSSTYHSSAEFHLAFKLHVYSAGTSYCFRILSGVSCAFSRCLFCLTYIHAIPLPQEDLYMRNICCNRSVCLAVSLYKTHMLIAILVYDYFLTLHLEISRIWNSRFTAAKLFFLLNRYGSIAYFCINCISWTIQTESVSVRSFLCFSCTITHEIM